MINVYVRIPPDVGKGDQLQSNSGCLHLWALFLGNSWILLSMRCWLQMWQQCLSVANPLLLTHRSLKVSPRTEEANVSLLWTCFPWSCLVGNLISDDKLSRQGRGFIWHQKECFSIRTPPSIPFENCARQVYTFSALDIDKSIGASTRSHLLSSWKEISDKLLTKEKIFLSSWFYIRGIKINICISYVIGG